MPRALLFDAPRPRLIFYAGPLDEAVRLDVSNPKWVQLCSVGSYVYRGERVEITPALLDQMVLNFHAHPAYSPEARKLFGQANVGVDAAARFGVIALNFDHPPMGSPRPGHGWFLELERRDGSLWGLCWFAADAHEGLVAGRWKWTSIEWGPNVANNQGQKIGPYLSGVALTNDPFITGMVPIQMRRPDGPAAVVWFGPATDVLCELRGILALPETSDVGAVIGEIAKLRTWALGEQSPPLGVDVGALVARIRGLLNLPTLTDAANIFAELDKLLAALAAEQPETPPMPDPVPSPAALARVHEIVKRFAARTLTFGSVPVAVDDEPGLVLAFERFMSRYDDAMAHMAGLQQTFGTKDPAVMLDKITKLMALEAQMAEILPELKAAAEAEEQAEGDLVTTDVNTVMAAQRIDPANTGLVEALTMSRRGDVHSFKFAVDAQGNATFDSKTGQRALASPKERRERRAAAREKFLNAHGMSTKAPPSRLAAAVGPAMFAGTNAQYAPLGAQQHQGVHFAAQGPGVVPYQAPTQPGAFTWARVSQLPPNLRGDNPGQRIYDELVRTEYAGKQPDNMARAQLWTRVRGILNDLSAREGQPPAQFRSA